MRTLIRGGEIVTSTERYRGDILIEGERITHIGKDLQFSADRVIDAKGRYVFPGGVDVHVHLDMPTTSERTGGPAEKTCDDFITGTIAAAFGGTTTIIDFPSQFRGWSLRSALENWFARASGKACVDYGFHMIIGDLRPDTFEEMDALVDEGITSFKVFTAYPDRFMLDDGSIFRIMRRARENRSLVLVHSENQGVIEVLVEEARRAGRTEPVWHGLTRPPEAEAEATGRMIDLAALAGCPVYIVHLSCTAALERVVAARRRGLRVYAETCPQYLFLTLDQLTKEGFEGAKYVCSPPLREAHERDRLWHALTCGDLQVVATDHCAFSSAQREQGRGDFTKIPGGLPGVETRLVLLYQGVVEGRLDLCRFVDLVATTPARLFGLYPRKGTISVGSDADLVVFNPEVTWSLDVERLHHPIDYSPYEGMQVQGQPETVLLRGRVIVENGRFTGQPGDGVFLPRAPFGSFSVTQTRCNGNS